ncbi:TetR family transcriptional regulator [Streptomyces sp. CB02959]|uniref:TetR/AcrR family transcriptional regulator n=1 Tax=Streptomyces sp. CB02959 TaxID=2020330 RepID=UPI000C273DDB|nr:TetR/AcrR family transcriptional regulator [Streptomyces sp. CB02959]PJN36184.1 TetR family transcriptional regulator [Streptomyces sp. CB02959]
MIVAAALPLIAEHGAAVTTSRIARAAGIGEATIFRAFKDKEELLDACAAEAVGVEHVLRELASVPLDEPLAARLTEAAEALCAHLERMGTVIGSLYASGHRRDQLRPPEAGADGEPPQDGRTRSFHALQEAVVELIEPDRERLRLSPERVAAAFLGLLFSRLPAPGGPAHTALTPAELISVLLHGTLTDPGSA